MTIPTRIGRYLVFGEIASGGMGTVHLGRVEGAVGFSRAVVVKRMHPHYARNPEFVRMFVDEARLASRVNHPNVVSTIDVVGTDEEVLVVMEYVHGESLSRLQRGAPIPWPIALSVVTQMLYGLHAAHDATDPSGKALDLVHRDVSPQNVIVDIDGVARLLDFGVAKAAWRLEDTRDGALKGKLGYMSPEQLRWESIDRRADVFAASVVLWEALTGRRLFSSGESVDVATRILDPRVDPPSRFVQSIPQALDDVVMRGLAQERDARFSTALAMAAELEGVGAHSGPREVGDWVRATAAEALARRTAMLNQLEGAPVPATPGSARLLHPGEEVLKRASAQTVVDVGTPSDVGGAPPVSGTKPSTSWNRRALAAAALLVFLAGSWLVTMRVRARHPPRTPLAVTEHGVLSSTASVPIAAQPTAPTAPTSSEPSLASPSSSTVRTRPSPTTHTKQPGTKQAGQRGTPRVCDPLYTVDSDGVKRFKPECF